MIQYKKYWRKSALKPIDGQEIIKLIYKKKIKNFLEIGVFTGVSAKNICRALQDLNGKEFSYVGLDLFEDYNLGFDSEIAPSYIRQGVQKFSNPIKHFYYNLILNENLNSVKSIENFLKKFSEQIKLIKGDTKNTLKNLELSIFDMIFVDGGHSYETVSYELDLIIKNVKKSCCIIVDDYFHNEAKDIKKVVDKFVELFDLKIKIIRNKFAILEFKL